MTTVETASAAPVIIPTALAQITVLPVSVATIFDAPNSTALFQANAAECLVPDAVPQRAIYEAMEQAGALKCFAAHLNTQLIGFISVIITIMPHNGKRIATVESIFVDPIYRVTGAGDSLLDAIDKCAEDSGCIGITGAARKGSRLEKVLARRAGYQQTHSVYTRWLA